MPRSRAWGVGTRGRKTWAQKSEISSQEAPTSDLANVERFCEAAEEFTLKRTSLLFLPFFLLACSDGGSPAAVGEFAIYTLQDPKIDARAALSYPIGSLPLNSTPFLTAGDLKSYTWATHSLDLKPEFRAKWEDFQRNGGSVFGVPFVVTVGTQRIYVGTFWWAYSSLMPPACAVVEVLGPGPYRIRMDRAEVDNRSDGRIHSALQAAGVLVE